MSLVRVNTAVFAATHLATNMLRSLKQIIIESGLDPGKLAEQWPVLEKGVSTWLASQHLRQLTLEVWDGGDPDQLIGRFDFSIEYDYDADGDDELWLDPNTVHQAIRKAGSYAAQCEYRFVADNAPGRPDVAGWAPTEYRSTDGMRRLSVGTAVGGGSLGAKLSYYRKG
jgi:hypothetical protein